MLRINTMTLQLSWGLLLIFSLMSVKSWGLESAQFQQESAYDGMEIEDLMALSITSLSKHQEPVSKAAAAVFVLTSEDIRRSPVTSLIEALRLIPGLNVQRINNTRFNVSIRGLNGPFPKHLLVMVDGRSIYNPLYAGVYWEQRDIPLSIIDRIEVVRGPGGAVWGSNALNGVINIITKSSALQQRGTLTTHISPREKQATVVVGGEGNDLQKSTTWRLFADEHRYERSDEYGYENSYGQLGQDELVDDSGIARRVGARVDSMLDNRMQWWADTQYYQANTDYLENVFEGNIPRIQNVDVDIEGYTFNSQLSQNLSQSRQWSVQLFAEYYDRKLGGVLRERQGQLDISSQYRFLAGVHNITLGGNYRGYTDDYDGTEDVYLQPDSEYNYLVAGFVQDKITFSDSWALTLGAKFERHRVQSTFIQPTARLSWSAQEDLTVWFAYSKAMQAQTRDLRGIHWRLACVCNTPLNDVLDGFRADQLNGLPPAVLVYANNNPAAIVPIITVMEGQSGNEFETQLAAWEWGVRARLAENWVLDLSAYFHEYSDIITAETSEYRLFYNTQGIDYVERVLHYSEGVDALSNGADLVLNWQWGRDMMWRFSYSYFNLDVKPKSGESIYYEFQEYLDPLHQASIQHDWTVTERWHLNTFIRYVDKAPYFSGWDSVDAYTTVDVKVNYAVLPELDVFIIGKNMFDSGHVEGRVVSDQPNAETEVERSFTMGFSVDF